MSKKARPKQRAATSRRKRRTQSGGGLLIALGVVVVILAVLIGMVFALEGEEPADIPYPDVPRISVNETSRKLEAGEILLVDVRSKTSYDSLHITGALSVPEEQVGTRLNELPVDQEIVLYCT
jgi:hypothetical protein